MKMALKKTSISLLLLVGVASAFANPGLSREEREAMHAARQQQRAQGEGQRAEMPRQLQEERRRGVDAGAPNNPSNAAPDASKKPGRLSPEERRALRRQINEAGQDIYAPKR